MHKSLFFLFYFLIFISAWGEAANPAPFPLQATYRVDSNWQSGYEMTVILKNTTSTPTSSWTATFTLPQGQSISSLWNGSYQVSGQLITVTNPKWMGGEIIPAGGLTTFGMVISNPQLKPASISGLQAMANGSTTPSTIPNAPILNAINVSPTSPSTYTLSWNSVPNASTYQLQQDTTSHFSHPQVIAQGTMLTYTVNNQPNGTYYYRVAAVNAAGASPYSNVQSITIQLQLGTPVLQPIDNETGESRYLISWNPVSQAQGYTLEESTSSDFANFQTLYHGSNTSYQVSGKLPGTYFYRVNAFSGAMISPYSQVEEVIVTQQPPQTAAIIEGYWESWNSIDPIDAIVNMQVDVIDIAFANFASTGLHTYKIAGLDCDQATLTQFIAKAHQAGKKVKISIGGATYGLSAQLQTTQDAVGMAQAVALFVQQNGLDGVDFDIEDYPAPNLQVALIQNTRQLLGNQAIISYTPKSPAATTYPYNQVIQAGHVYLNYISIMAYDYGFNYSYQQDSQALEAMGVPASKIIIGLMPGYDDLGVMTSLDDIKTAAEYVMNKGLGGVMFWDLNRDHENLTGLGKDAATATAWDVLH